MSTTIDERVVSMRFDNAQFENGIATTSNSLSKFSSQLDSTFSNSRGLGNLSKALASIPVNKLNNSIQTVKASFSALQVMGTTALARLTNSAITAGVNIAKAITNPIIEGGKNRAMNIEAAKFQLKGLGVEWSKIEEDINYGVKDTAYGLDAAAKAASQLVASDVKLGDDMKAALRGISGTAAMTNSTYEEISNIWTRVAGNGRVFAMDLQSLSSRGLNAAATLGKALGKTEAEIRTMVSKGEIDFATFSKAMDDAFGEHAKEANKTFTGALSNVKSALSRIGADVQAAKMESLRKVFVNLIPVIDKIKLMLGPVIEDLSKGMEYASNVASKALKTIEKALPKKLDDGTIDYGDFANSFISNWRSIADNVAFYAKKVVDGFKEFYNLKGIQYIFEGFHNILQLVLQVLNPIGAALKSLIPGGLPKIFADLTKRFADFTQGLWLSIDAQEGIRKSFTYIFEAASKLFNFMASKASKVIKVIHDIVDGFFSFVNAHIGIKQVTDDMSFLDKAIAFILDKFNKLKTALTSITFGDVFEGLKSAFSGVMKFVDNLKASIEKLVSYIGTFLKGAFDSLKTSLEGSSLGEILSSTTVAAGGLIGLLVAFKLEFMKLDFGELINTITTVFSTLRKSISQFTNLPEVTKPDQLLKLAEALALVAASVFLLSLTDPDALARALEALGLEILGLMTSFKALTTMKFNEGEWYKVTIALLALAISIGIMAAALTLMSFIPTDKIWTAILGLVAIFAVLAAGVFGLSKVTGELPKISALLISFSISILILAVALGIMALIPFDRLMAGIFAIVLALTALGIFTGFMKNMSGKFALLGVGLIAMATGLLILSVALAVLSLIPFDNLFESLILLTVAMAAFMALGILFGKFAGKIALAGLALLVLAIGLTALCVPLILLSMVPLDRLSDALFTLVVAMVAFGAIGAILGFVAGPIALAGAALIVLGLGLLAISIPLILLSAIPIETLSKRMAFLCKALINLGKVAAIIGFVSPLILLLGVSLVLLGVGLLAIAIPLTILSAIDANAMAASLMVLCQGLVAFGMVALLLLPATIAIAALGVALLILGPGLLVVSAAVLVLAKAFQILIQALMMLAPGIAMVTKAILDGLGALCDKIIEAFKSHFGINSPSKVFKDFGMNMILGLVNGIKENILKAVNGIKDLGKKLFEAFKKIDFKKVGVNLVKGLINGIKNSVGGAVKSIKDLGSKMLSGLKKVFNEHSPSKETEWMGAHLGNGLILGIRGVSSKVVEEAETLGKNALSGFDTMMNGLSDFNDVNPKISPVLDLDNVNKGMTDLNGMLNSTRTLDLANTSKIASAALDSVDTSAMNNASIVNAINDLQAGMDALWNKMGNLQIIMDSGAVVGELASPMDEALGARSIRAQRSYGTNNRKISYS